MSRLEATVGIKNGPFKNGLNEMRAQAKAFGNDIKSTIAGAFAFGAVASFVSNFVGEMGRIKDISDRLGESTDTIQRVGNAAKLSGTDLEYAIKILNKMGVEAAKSSKEYDALGISGTAFANAGIEERALMLAKAFDECNGSQEKMLKLMDRLGPKGQDMLTMLSGGAEELKKLFEGVPVVNAQAINATAKFGDAVDWISMKSKEALGSVVGLFQGVSAQYMALYETITSGGNYYDNLNKVRDEWKLNDEKVTGGGNRKKDLMDAAQEAADKAKEQQKEQDKIAAALQARDEEMLKLARSRMDEEAKIADLKREQAKYAAIVNDKSKPQSERLDAEKHVLEIQQQIDTASDSAAKKHKEVEDEKKRQALEKMGPEERIAELKKRQAELNAEADKAPGKQSSDDKRMEALKMNGEIDSAQKEIDDKKKKEADDAEKKQKEIADAEGAYAEEQNKQRLDKMSPLERIKELKRQQKELNDAAAKDPDAKSRAEKKTEALKLNDEIDKAQKELDGDKGGKKPAVVTSSLASIGGGGRTYIGADPALTESRRQTSLLQQLVRNTSQGGEAVAMTSKNPF